LTLAEAPTSPETPWREAAPDAMPDPLALFVEADGLTGAAPAIDVAPLAAPPPEVVAVFFE
jgi:hypothetical protein